MRFHNILVPADGSKYSEYTVKTAIEIVMKFNGEITLLHVASLKGSLSLDLYEDTKRITHDKTAKIIGTIREVGFDILAHGKKVVEAHDVPVKTLFKEGHVVQEIVKTTREGDFDLIVLGAKGISEIKEIPLGSVSEKVIRNAPCSVVVVK